MMVFIKKKLKRFKSYHISGSVSVRDTMPYDDSPWSPEAPWLFELSYSFEIWQAPSISVAETFVKFKSGQTKQTQISQLWDKGTCYQKSKRPQLVRFRNPTIFMYQ